MALPKLFERIFWHNITTPSINEDNLNSMSKAIDDIDNRVIQVSGDILEVVPQIQAYLEQAEDLVEAIELMAENPPYIGANGNWYVWNTDTNQYVDSGIDASITVDIADITMLATDASPYVTNTGTSTDPVFHLYIPRGETGNGIESVAKTGTSGLVDTYTITFTNGQTTTFTVTNGGGMEIDGSNADSHVLFDGAFTVGSRASGDIGENSVVFGSDPVAFGESSFAQGRKTKAGGYCSVAEGVSGAENHVIFLNESIGGVMAQGDTISFAYEGFLPTDKVVFTVDNTELYNGRISDMSYTAVVGGNQNYDVAMSKSRISDGVMTVTVTALVTISSASTKIPVRFEADTFTNAMGRGSHSEGHFCTSGGDYSHAEGESTVAARVNQHVSGRYNDNKSDTLFEVGNGTDAMRSNAFEVYDDGSISTDNGVTKVKLENKSALSGSTELSLVSRGDKATWNGKEDAPVVLTQTMAAGNTQVMFSDSHITSTAMYDVYTDKAGLNYTEIDDSSAGTLIVKFEAQTSQITVKLVIR